MTKPVALNEALVPRRDRTHGASGGGQQASRKRATDPEAAGYAPPGSSIRARVKSLGDETETREADPVAQADLKHSSSRLTNDADGKGSRGIVMKIEAEVTVVGDLPEEGVQVETVTVLRPNRAQERQDD